MVNRCAVILKYCELMIRWLNEADPYEDQTEITAESLRNDRNVYLLPDIPAYVKQTIDTWIDANLDALIENEFEVWHIDSDLWPKDWSPSRFREWFEIEYHCEIVDTVGGEIYDNET